MSLRSIGTVELPAHRAKGGFDHAAVHRRADRLYVASNDAVEVIDRACDSATVVTVEAASGRVVARTPIGGAPDVVFFNPRRNRLYVAMGDPGILQSIDPAEGRVVETIPTGRGAHTFGFHEETEQVYVLAADPPQALVFSEA